MDTEKQITYDTDTAGEVKYGVVASETDAQSNTTTYTYDATYTYLEAVENALRHTTKYEFYPLTGKIKSIADHNITQSEYEGEKRTKKFEYNAFGYLTKIEGLDSGGSVVTLAEYDYYINEPNMAKFGIRERRRESYGSDEELISMTFYDGALREIEKIREAVVDGEERYVISEIKHYDHNGKVVKEYMPFKVVSHSGGHSLNGCLDSYISIYPLVLIASPSPGQILHEYDALGREITTTTYPNGGIKKYIFDGDRVTFHDENCHQAIYPWRRKVITQKDAHGNIKDVMEYTMGSSGWQFYRGTNYTYTPLGELKHVGSLTNPIDYTYDKLGRLKTKTDNVYGLREFEYDDNGNLLNVYDGGGLFIENEYDALNRLESTRFIREHIDVIYGYDPNSERLSYIDVSRNTATFYQKEFDYDRNGRVTKVTETIDGEHSYSKIMRYDPLDRIEEMRIVDDGRSVEEIITYSYDTGGNINHINGISPQPYIEQIEYKEDNQIAAFRYGSGVTTNYSYHPQTKNLIGIQVPLTTKEYLQNLEYKYDKTGNIVSIVENIELGDDRQKVTEFGYDDLCRLTQLICKYTKPTSDPQDHPIFRDIRDTVLDVAGPTIHDQPTEKRYLDKIYVGDLEVSYPEQDSIKSDIMSYDTDPRVDPAIPPAAAPAPEERISYEIYYEYDEIDNIKKRNKYLYGYSGEFIDEWVERLDWTMLQDLPIRKHLLKSSEIEDQIEEDPGPTIGQDWRSESSSVGHAEFDDPIDKRIMEDVFQTKKEEEYVYSYQTYLTTDSAKLEDVTGRQDSGIDNINYDSHGNITGAFGKAYAYDSLDRLISVNDNTRGSLMMEFMYNEVGGRIKKVADGVATYYFLDGLVEVKEEITTIYYKLEDKILAKKEGEDVYYFHNDHLGSPNLLTDEVGNTLERITYFPYGHTYLDIFTYTPEERIAKKYTGQQWDSETGLYYYGGRPYDSDIGRFLSPDPAMTAVAMPEDYIADPRYQNPYAFCRGNPMIRQDSTSEDDEISLDLNSIELEQNIQIPELEKVILIGIFSER